MIGYLQGEVFEIFENYLLILVNGVGYKVFPATSSIEKIKRGSKSAFYIAAIIKEDAFDLYGFLTLEEKNLFELIVSISGIGPKTAQTILSSFRIDDIVSAISRSDSAFFSGIPRLGKKNAQKLIIELKTKVGDLTPVSFEENKEREELVDALKAFGYQEREIMPLISKIEENGGDIQKKITFALKILGKN